MTQKEKDDLCDGRSIQNALDQFHSTDQRNQSPSLKRHRTNGSDLQYDHDHNHDLENYNEGFNHNTRNSKYQRRNNHLRNDQSLYTNSRIYINSNSNTNENRNVQQQHQIPIDSIELTDQEHNNHQILRISNHALNYAASTYLQPIKLECEPKLKEQKAAAKFIQQFFKFIDKDFYQQNITYQKPTGFEQW